MPYDSKKDRYPIPSDNGGCVGRADDITATISDTVDFANYYTSLYVGVSGDITCVPIRNTADIGILYKSVPAGFFPVAVRRVYVTGTNAASLIGNRD